MRLRQLTCMDSDVSFQLARFTERLAAFIALVQRKTVAKRRRHTAFVCFMCHHVLRQVPKPLECLAACLHTKYTRKTN